LCVEDLVLLGRGDDHPLRKHFLARFGAPAYVRRARAVQDALEQLLDRCRRQRNDLLDLVRCRLAMLRALAGDWAVVRIRLQDDQQLDVLRDLHAGLEPRLRLSVQRTTSLRKLHRALRELQESLERFNSRWQAFVSGVDFSHINELRVDYNRYYVLEKECAVRSPVLARQGFTRLEPFTKEQLLALLPPLPVPRLAP
jgi:hypothetical protein